MVQILASSFFPIFGNYRLDFFTFKNWINVFSDLKAMNGLKNTILFSAGAAVTARARAVPTR